MGLLATNLAVTKRLGWIFRDQPLVDVGIDAIIEKSDDGNPAGKFIAVQVKAGEGNFNVRKDYLTHYVSSVHYHYWTNLNIPIILVAHLPGNDDCYWEAINSKTLKKTKKKWKIELSKSSILDENAKKRLESILATHATTDIYSAIYGLDYEADTSEYYEVLSESQVCALRINKIISDLGIYFHKSREKNDRLAQQGYTENDPQLKGVVKQQGKHIVATSRRLTLEVQIFSKTFPEEFYVIEKMIYTETAKGSEGLNELVDQVRQMPAVLDKAISGINELQEIAEIGTRGYPVMQKSLKTLAEALSILSSEYSDARQLALSLSS